MSFSEEVSTVEQVAEEYSAWAEETTTSDAAGLEPAPAAAAELQAQKRGRPCDTPLQKAEKAMKKAETRKKDAKRDLFKERDEFKAGAMWDAPSVAQRVKERILKHADKVLDLQCEYEEAREAWVEARIEDAVARALTEERAWASAVHARYEERVAHERYMGALKLRAAVQEHQLDLLKLSNL